MKGFERQDAALTQSERFCHRMARAEAKNFYWGFISLGREQRTAIYALYDFARQVDDDADDSARPHLRERLEAHRDRVHRAMSGQYGSDPIMHVLSIAVDRFRIPERELQALIDGVEMDFDRSRYATWEELQDYCRLVASVVGRMCVRVFGFDEATALVRADELGLALQLINILRDVREDAEMGRIYLPQEDLARFGVSEDALSRGAAGDGWGALVEFEAERARRLWESGIGVLSHIPWRPGVCVSTMAGIYRRILERIAADPYLPLHERASLGNTEKLGVMVQSWLRAG